MPVISEVKNRREQIISIASRHRINNIKVFGSVVREEETPDSDIDFLVDCKEECSLFDLIAFKDELENVLNRKVDVVTEKSIHWTLKDKILKEAREI